MKIYSFLSSWQLLHPPSSDTNSPDELIDAASRFCRSAIQHLSSSRHCWVIHLNSPPDLLMPTRLLLVYNQHLAVSLSQIAHVAWAIKPLQYFGRLYLFSQAYAYLLTKYILFSLHLFCLLNQLLGIRSVIYCYRLCFIWTEQDWPSVLLSLIKTQSNPAW